MTTQNIPWESLAEMTPVERNEWFRERDKWDAPIEGEVIKDFEATCNDGRVAIRLIRYDWNRYEIVRTIESQPPFVTQRESHAEAYDKFFDMVQRWSSVVAHY